MKADQAPEGAPDIIYSRETPGETVDDLARAVYSRIADVLERDAERILPVWISALRSTSAFYAGTEDAEFMGRFEPILRAYRQYFLDGDPLPFLALVGQGVRLRFSQGFPLVDMEKNVGAVRTAVLPFVLPVLHGDPRAITLALDAMITVEELCFVEIAQAYQELSTAALVAAQESALNAEREKVAFCRDMARLVTHGKLILCEHEDVPPRPDADRVDINVPRDVRDARHAAALHTASWPEDRSYSLQLCIGEAGSNALRHAGGATFEVWSQGDSVTCRLADTGPGIEFGNIPTVLSAGFSTGSSLGMGFTLMLDQADRVELATDHRGTTLQITFKAEPES